jgi:signal peptidase II
LALNNYFSKFNGNFLSFELMINRGISWSLFHSEDNKVFLLISSIVLIIITVFLFHIKSKIAQKKNILAEILILSGAISNFADRIFHAGVIDFIVISFAGWSWPVFNIADMSIVIGTIILLIEIF